MVTKGTGVFLCPSRQRSPSLSLVYYLQRTAGTGATKAEARPREARRQKIALFIFIRSVIIEKERMIDDNRLVVVERHIA